jgi:hypothetical protein
MGEELHMAPSATRAQSANAVEQIRTAKPRTRTQGVPTASECQSDPGTTLRIAHTSAAPMKPVDTFDPRCRLVPARGPRKALYSAPATQASTSAPQQVATPTTTSV